LAGKATLLESVIDFALSWIFAWEFILGSAFVFILIQGFSRFSICKCYIKCILNPSEKMTEINPQEESWKK